MGVVHKDVKPANMLLDRNENVCLSDFGCAEELERYDAGDTCRRTLGSPAFQSPVCPQHLYFVYSRAASNSLSCLQEIATGKTEFSGFNVDIWAAGVTLFHMVVGRTPFDADNLLDLYEKIGQAHVDLPQSLGLHLRDILSKLLCATQEQRIKKEAIRTHPWMHVDLGASSGTKVAVQQRKPMIMQYDWSEKIDEVATNTATQEPASQLGQGSTPSHVDEPLIEL